MKKKLLIVILVLLFNKSIAQEETSRIYEIISNIPVTPCNVIGQSVSSSESFFVPPYKSKFALVRNAPNDSVIIRFLNWTSPKNNALRIKFNGGNDEATKYFKITKRDLDSNCIKVYTRGNKSTVFTLGLVTMPMKLRLGRNFDFQGNLNLGTTAGAKMRISKYNPNYVNFLFGASISTVSLDSFSTGGRISGQPLTNIAVFSPSLGVVFEFGKAQAGIFYGWDFLNKATQSRYHWIYDRKPWISIGFGFSIFSINGTSSNQSNGENNVTEKMP